MLMLIEHHMGAVVDIRMALVWTMALSKTISNASNIDTIWSN